MLHLQDGVLVIGDGLAGGELYLAAYHHVGHLVQHVHQLSPVEDGAAVSDLFDLLNFVGDEDDGLAALAQLADDFEEEVDLLRG